MVDGQYETLEDPTNERPLTARELMQGDFPRASFVWDKFIVQGYPNLLTGEGGAGKTTLALQLATSVASGTDFLGLRVMQMPVLLVLAEDDNGETRHRYQLACDALGLSPNELDIHFWCRPGLDSTIVAIDELGGFVLERFARPLMRVIKELGSCLVIFDTVVDIAVLDENARVPVNTLAKRFWVSYAEGLELPCWSRLTHLRLALKAVLTTPDRPRGMAPTEVGWCCNWTSTTRKSEPWSWRNRTTARRMTSTYTCKMGFWSLEMPCRRWRTPSANLPQCAISFSSLSTEISKLIAATVTASSPETWWPRLGRRGHRMTASRVVECLNALLLAGILRYQPADNKVRGQGPVRKGSPG